MNIKKIFKNKTILFFIFLFGLTIFLYSKNLNAFFVSDDFDWISVSKDRNLTSFFTTNYLGTIGGSSYGPIINLIFYVSYKIGGMSPLPYHLFSIIFHFGNLILIYFLSKYFFDKKIGYLASLLFAVYFNNSEVISWISAVPHLSATFFYLFSVYLWLRFFDKIKNESKKNNLLVFYFSLISFFLALASKEIAISLPIILIILYIIQLKRYRLKFVISKFIFFVLPYFLILIFYLLLRYYTTGVIFGYYGRGEFDFNFVFYLKSFISYFITLLFSGELRVQARLLAIEHLYLFYFLIILFLTLFGFLLRKYLKYYISSLILIGSMIIVYLPLLINPFNNEGERYLYLPSTVLFIFLAFVFEKISVGVRPLKMGRTPLFIIIVIVSSFILYQKNIIWRQSSDVSKKIVSDFSSQVDLNKKDQKIVFLYLPDNLSGAQLFRNSIKEAINLTYPEYDLDAINLQSYVVLDSDNWNKNLIDWKSENIGILGTTVDSRKIITGIDRYEDDEIMMELWGYDYDNFTTDKIYIRPKGEIKKLIKEERVVLLYFDESRLKILNKKNL